MFIVYSPQISLFAFSKPLLAAFEMASCPMSMTLQEILAAAVIVPMRE